MGEWVGVWGWVGYSVVKVKAETNAIALKLMLLRWSSEKHLPDEGNQFRGETLERKWGQEDLHNVSNN